MKIKFLFFPFTLSPSMQTDEILKKKKKNKNFEHRDVVVFQEKKITREVLYTTILRRRRL